MLCKLIMNGRIAQAIGLLILLDCLGNPHRVAADESALWRRSVVDIRLSIDLEQLRELAVNPQGFVRATIQSGSEPAVAAEVSLQPQSQNVVRETTPGFIVKMAPSTLKRVFGDVTEFIIERSVFDQSQLERYAASRLASSIGLKTPEYGHCKLSLNGRELGVHTLVKPIEKWHAQGMEKDTSQWIRADALARIEEGKTNFTLLEHSLRDFRSRLSLAIEANPQLSDRKLEDVLMVEQVYRFLAWLSFVRNTTVLVAFNYWLFLDEKDGRAEVLPADMFRLFLAPKMNVLGGMEDTLSRRLLGTGEGRRRFIDAIALIATNIAAEKQVIADVEQRALLLVRQMTNPQQERNFNRHAELVVNRIKERFSEVRKQIEGLSKLSDQQLAVARIPKATTSDFARPKDLPVANQGIDYGIRFKESYARKQTTTSSVPAKVYEINVSATPGVLEGMSSSSTNWTPVNASCDGAPFDRVGFRLKGRGSRDGLLGNPSFTLKFNLEHEGRQFDGNTKVHLHSAILNASMLNEYIASWVFNRAGLPCPRVNFAHVTINSVDFGLMVMVEGTTKPFLGRAFGESDGLLFEGEHTDINGPLDLDSGHLPNGFDGIVRLVKAAQVSLATKTFEALDQQLDVKQFTRFTTAEVLLGHSDGYAQAANNYRLYRSTKDGRFRFLPHGMDHLTLDQPGAVPQMKGLLAQVLIETGRDLYLKSLSDLLTATLSMEQLSGDIAATCQVIQKALIRYEPLRAPAQLASAQQLVRQMGLRKTYLMEQIVSGNTNTLPAIGWQRTSLKR